jgi:hypothetical protein
MRFSTLLVFVALGAGCHTIQEELPTAPGRVNGLTSLLPGTPLLATPTPAPTPTPAATPTPAPTPTPQAAAPIATAPEDPGPIAKIRVGFFGINCGKGQPSPRNGEGLLPIGCRGYVTATPKDKNGDDVPKKVHGPNIEWELEEGQGSVEVLDPTFESDFNKDLVGRRSGAFSLCATVKGVRGCLKGNVQPR